MTEAAPRAAFAAALPQSGAGTAHAGEEAAAYARRAEELGLHSLWVQEQLLGSDPSLEPIVNLAFVAACTSRVRLGTAAIVAPPRNPVVLAKQLTSLDRLSGGRLIAGIALGDMPQLYEASGVPMAERGRRLDETVRVLKALWAQEPLEATGPLGALAGARMSPGPLQHPHPPLWFGGRSDRALARAAREGQGWVAAGGRSTAAFVADARRLRALLEPGRDFTIAKKVYIAVEDTAGEAERRLASWFAVHWGGAGDAYELARDVGVSGTEEECAAQLDRLVEAGRPDLVILNPVYDEAIQLERLAHGVLPLFGHRPRPEDARMEP